jgi:hypothetical protein
MIHIRRSGDRGRADHGWLDTRHTFSFADYYDPDFMGFGHLRVINEDRVAPGTGFGRHPHRDMEIITYVLEGGLAHQDSTGSGGVIRPGEVQVMSAGTGVTHSEMNASKDEPVHFMQIWIVPERRGLRPRYDQRRFEAEGRRDRLQLLVSKDGADGSLSIGQDARLYAAELGEGKTIEYRIDGARRAWLQIARGSVQLEEHRIEAGDGVAIAEEDELRITANESSEVLLFDLP